MSSFTRNFGKLAQKPHIWGAISADLLFIEISDYCAGLCFGPKHRCRLLDFSQEAVARDKPFSEEHRCTRFAHALEERIALHGGGLDDAGLSNPEEGGRTPFLNKSSDGEAAKPRPLRKVLRVCPSIRSSKRLSGELTNDLFANCSGKKHLR